MGRLLLVVILPLMIGCGSSRDWYFDKMYYDGEYYVACDDVANYMGMMKQKRVYIRSFMDNCEKRENKNEG